jgi:fibronectin-binding autotransporter adhesin
LSATGCKNIGPEANSTSIMNIPGLVVDEIHFTGAGNTIEGSTALTVSGSALIQNIVSEADGNTLGATLALTLSGAPVEAASSAGTLTLAGSIGGAAGLVFAGSGGSLALTGANSYTGATTIVSGALHIATPAGQVIVGSALTIGTGTGATAELILDQSSDISPQTPVTVNSNGVFDFQSYTDTAKSLTVNGGRASVGTLIMSGPLVVKEGTVTIGGLLSAGSLSMTGGTIGAPGAGALALAGDIQATSSPTGPATVSSAVRLGASPTVTVTPGTAPELRLTGAVGETGGSRSIAKGGTGTMLMSANNTYTGTTTVSEGTLVANGSQSGAFSVARNGTLSGSGTVGATTVAGVLAPTAPGLGTGALSFGPTGRLEVTLTSFAPATIPAVLATGAVAIDPSAVLNLVVAPGTGVLPQGPSVLLIDNHGPDAITGQFSGIPNNFLLSTVEGPLQVNYAGGDDNDLSLTAASPPQAVAPLGVAPAGASPNPPAPPTSAGTGTALTSTVKSSGYGADFGLTAPSACVRPGAPFGVTLSIATHTKGRGTKGKDGAKGKGKGNAKGGALTVRKVLFAIGRKVVGTARSAPYRAQLFLPPTATPGSTVKLLAKAYLQIPGGKPRTKSIAVPVKVC